MSQGQVRQAERVRIDAVYFVGAAVRVAAVTLFLVIGFALLDVFRSAAVWGAVLGTVGFETGLSWRLVAALFSGLVPLLWPFSIVAMIAECQILLLKGVGFSPSTVQVLIPAAFGGVGGFLGFVYFEQFEDIPVAGLRMLVVGSALLFYLAASVQLWNWDQWQGSAPGTTPVLWYGILICLVGGFLGSRIAWDAPSPYVKETIQYRKRVWDRAKPPTAPLLPYEEPPGY